MSTARASFLSAPRCISQTIFASELTASVNGAAQTITLSEGLPAQAIVLQRWITVNTEFSGGGVATMVADVGWSGGGADPNGWYAAENIFTGSGTGIRNVPGTTGARLDGGAADVETAARAITVAFDPDAGHALEDLTAGSLSVNVIYVIQAANDLILP